MSQPIQSVCVYCGASMGKNPAHRAFAEALGKGLAERGIKLVYGGGHVGLMGAVADAVMAGGGEVHGVIPGHLHDMEVAHEGVTDLEIVSDMHTRKKRMFDLSDAFIALPGGFGTLDETFELLTWHQIGLHKRPLWLAADAGYWQPLLAMVDHQIEAGFVKPADRGLFGHHDTLEALFAAIDETRVSREGEHMALA